MSVTKRRCLAPDCSAHCRAGRYRCDEHDPPEQNTGRPPADGTAKPTGAGP